MKQLNLFIQLIRLKQPIGFMLLFWPCSWGLTIAYDFSKNIDTYFLYSVLFFMGSVLMRSAGCIVNDITDKEFDKKVERTKNRPIAAGKISIRTALFYTLILCTLAFLVLINFNLLTIILAIASMPLAFTYPLIKRYTYWPQLFLGITFNYGLILGWVSITNDLNIVPVVFYFGAIFWTLGYDTIYGFSDIVDDEIIGVKSTSIKFKKKAKDFLILCYFVLTLSLLIVGYLMKFNIYFYFSIILTVIHLFFYQIRLFNFQDTKKCLKIFRSNNTIGILVLLNILVGKI